MFDLANNSKEIKAKKAAMQEKIVNDFLLQFTFSILSAMLLMYIYNGRLFKYGSSVGNSMPAFIWILFGVFAVLGIIFTYLYKNKGKNGFKVAAIYMFILCAGMFWCIGFETLFNLFNIVVPFFNAKRAMEALFILIGVSVVVEFVIYFIRSAKVK